MGNLHNAKNSALVSSSLEDYYFIDGLQFGWRFGPHRLNFEVESIFVPIEGYIPEKTNNFKLLILK